MAQYVTWLNTAWQQYREMTAYMAEHYSYDSAERFTDKILAKLDRLLKQPEAGRPTRLESVRYVMIDRHRSLFYRYQGETIYVVFLWDGRRDPTRNPFW